MTRRCYSLGFVALWKTVLFWRAYETDKDKAAFHHHHHHHQT